ncbi:MAG: tetratricopeptide repeat protein [Paludibacteraceae bacterium]|nr:tetratricopeptide repeat protein [Paludibacteraceae bacterium]MBR1481244.1 tetratricopeptide repeat protein [Paludibacteraceae bacterium]
MAKKDFKKEDEQLENVNEALSSSAQWFVDHKDLLTWCVAGVLLVVIIVMAVSAFVVKPNKEEAANKNALAEAYFVQGDYAHALDGDKAECEGFRQVAKDYSLYQEGKLAALYAGVCSYELGELEDAAKYLGKFSADDVNIGPAAAMRLGDVYVELDEYGKAVKAFDQAAASENEFIAPMALKKKGLVLLEQDNKKGALKAFETIKKHYPQSSEAQDIDKYISLAK